MSNPITTVETTYPEDGATNYPKTYMQKLLAGEDMTIEEQLKGFAETQAKVMKLIYG